MKYVVPYSAPGIKWGQLRIDAGSSDDAVDRAHEIHTRAYRLASNLGWAGPGYRRMFAAAPSRHRLAKRERSQITYGEPLALVDAVAS